MNNVQYICNVHLTHIITHITSYMTAATTTRREREKVEMQQLIVDTAIKMYIEEGYDKLTLRGIAQRIEYAAGTLYLYFKDKHELFHAMHQWAFKQLLEKMERELPPIQNPVDRLRAMSDIYITFAFENPELYDLMFILNEPMCAEANMDDWPCGQSVYNLLVTTVQEAIDKHLFKDENAHTLAFMFWSSSHGMISLYLRNRLRMYAGEDLKQLINYTEDMILRHFLARPSYVPFVKTTVVSAEKKYDALF
jgi:AcrR family transcriptional regulator